jgi:uncharacterized protein (DUF362 family)
MNTVYKLSVVDMRMQSESPIVAVVKGERGHTPVFKALDLIDYRNALLGYDTVLIKVNFITNKTWDTGATTDPIVVEAIIKKLEDLPVKVYVVESDATITNADKAFEATGMKDMCSRNGVEWLNARALNKSYVSYKKAIGFEFLTIYRSESIVECLLMPYEKDWNCG